MKRLLLFAVLAAGAAHGAHTRLEAVPGVPDDGRAETLASAEALRWLALGYDSLVADYYWLRAIDEFGRTERHATNYPNLEPFLSRTLALDPDFASAYVFAGTALTLKGMDPRRAVEILQAGLAHRPDVWRIPFLLGFNAYYFLGDYHIAAEALAVAARLPDIPEFVAPLATRIAAEAGEPEVGLALVDALLESTEDERLRATYLERRQLLLLEVALRQLEGLVREYTAQHGAPQSLEDLVRVGLVAAIPPDPLGGRFYLDAAGHAATSSEEHRLRLPDAARGAPR